MGSRLWRIANWEQVAIKGEFKPAKVAKLCSVSQRQLERFFSDRFQTTPRQWLRELQCSMAMQFIAKGFSNKMTAAELKFADSSHLCHVFKKVKGVTPQSLALTEAERQFLSRINNGRRVRTVVVALEQAASVTNNNCRD